jgi:hypothetical protein
MLTRWRLGSWLMQRWNINPINLVQCVIEGLPVYHPETLVNIFPWPQSDGRMLFCFPPLREGPWSVKTLSAIIHMCQFKLNEVEKFETKHPNLFAQALPSNTEDIEAQLGEAPNPVSKEPSTIETAPNQGENFFIFDGYHWRVGFKGQEKSIKGTNGVWYIVHLLAAPNQKIGVLELFQLVKGTAPEDEHEDEHKPYSNMGNEQLAEEGLHTTRLRVKKSPSDKKWSASLEKQAKVLLANLEKAKKGKMQIEIDEAKKEYYDFINSLTIQKGKKSDEIDKARINVSNRIQTAIANIKKAGLQDLSDYLDTHIQKGKLPTYSPNPENPIDWNIKFQSN